MFEISHLKKAKQSYISHCYDAFLYSYVSLKASVIFFIHGLIPCIFSKTGSTLINELNHNISKKNDNLTDIILIENDYYIK